MCYSTLESVTVLWHLRNYRAITEVLPETVLVSSETASSQNSSHALVKSHLTQENVQACEHADI